MQASESARAMICSCGLASRATRTTSRGMAEHMGMGYQTVLRRLRELEDRGIVAPTRPKKSSKQSYRIVGQ